MKAALNTNSTDSGRITSLEGDVAELKTRPQDYPDLIKIIEEQQKSLKKAADNFTKQNNLLEAHGKALKKANSDLAKRDIVVKTARESLKHANDRNAYLEEQLSLTVDKRVDICKNIINAHRESIRKQDKEISDFKTVDKAQKESIEKLQESIGKQDQVISDLRTADEAQQKEIERLKRRFNDQLAFSKEVVEKKKKKNELFEKLSAAYDTLKDQYDELGSYHNAMVRYLPT